MNASPLPLLLTAMILAGCQSGNDEKGRDGGALGVQVAGSIWILHELDGQTVSPATPPAATLQFGRGGSISGTAACNNAGVPLNWRDGSFYRPANQDRVPARVFTVMACLDRQASETGTRFWQQMLSARAWKLAGETLTIQFADNNFARLRRGPSAVYENLPPKAPGANFPAGNTLALDGAGDIEGISDRQLMAMFAQAMSQQAPLPDTKIVCMGLQGVRDREMRDAPSFIVAQLLSAIGKPIVPASKCVMDEVPRHAVTQQQAILYTVKIEQVGETITFTAIATFGNLGASGAQYRLRPLRGGGFKAEPTGLTILS